MAELGDFFEQLLRRSGAEITPEWKNVLGQKGFTQVPDDMAKAITGGLMNRKEAIANGDVRNAIQSGTDANYEQKVWKFIRDKIGVDISEWKENWRPYDSEADKYKNSIYTDLDHVLSKAIEVATAKGEQNSGLSANELREKLKSEIGSEYTSKLEANGRTIAELQKANADLSSEKERILREQEDKIHSIFVRNHVEGLISNVPLKSSYDDDDKALIRKDAIERITSNYVIKKDEDGNFLPFQKDDPSARAVNSDNQLVDLPGLITETLSKKMDPNGGKTQNQTRVPVVQPNGDGNGISPDRLNRRQMLLG